MKLKPTKYAFGVTSKKFLRYISSQEGTRLKIQVYANAKVCVIQCILI